MNKFIFTCLLVSTAVAIVAPARATVLLKVGPDETYTTIQSAVDAVPSKLDEPYVIAIAPGRYPEMVTITGKQTSPVNNLTLTADPANPSTIDARGKDFAIDLIQQDNVVIEGLILSGAESWGDAFLDRCTNDRFLRDIFRSCAHYDGATLSGSPLNRFEHNLFYGNDRAGINLVNSSSGNIIQFNIFTDNAYGILMGLDYGPFTVSEAWNDLFQNARGSTSGFVSSSDDSFADPLLTDPVTLRVSGNSPVGAWGPLGVANSVEPASISTSTYVSPSVVVRLYSSDRTDFTAGQPVLLSSDCISSVIAEAKASISVWDENGILQQPERWRAITLQKGLNVCQAEQWSPPVKSASENYSAQAVVQVGDEQLKGNPFYFTVHGTAYSSRPGPVLTAHLNGGKPLGGSNILYGCEIQPLKQSNRGTVPDRIDPIIFDQLKANGGTAAHLIFWWSYLEPSPDVYDFSSIDWALAQCRRVGLKASISVWMADNVVPTYVADEDMLDQYGRPFMSGRDNNERPDIMPSLWGPKTRDYYGRLIKIICKRYLDDPTVSAWAFMYQHNEVILHDRVASPPILYDYSQFAQNAYRTYLSTERKWSLDQLNARYGTDYKSWQEVTEPAPATDLDTSLRWSDFQDFRQYSVRQSFAFIFQTVRSVDPTGRKVLWAFNPEGAEDIFDRYHAVPDYTSSEAPRELDRYLASRITGFRPIITEPTAIPPGPYQIGAGYFDALSAPDQGYWWVGTVRVLLPPSPALDLFRRDRDAWVQLSNSSAPSATIALLRSDDTALATDKVFFNYPRFWEMSPYDSLMKQLLFHHYDYQPIYSTFFQMAGGRFPRHYPLILDTDSIVMRKNLIERLLQQVDAGALLIIQPTSGQVCREYPNDSSKSLLARLGWAAASSPRWQPVQTSALTLDIPQNQPLLGGTTLRLGQRYPVETLKQGTIVHDSHGVACAIVRQLGKGRVVMLAGDQIWNDDSASRLLKAFTTDAAVSPRIVTSSDFRARIMRNGADTFVVLFNENGQDYVQSSVGLTLAPGRYNVVDFTDGMSRLPVSSSRQWSSGYPVILAPLELRVYRLTPLPSVNKTNKLQHNLSRSAKTGKKIS